MKRRLLRLSEMDPRLQQAVADPKVALVYYRVARRYAIIRLFPGSQPRRQGYWGIGPNKPHRIYTVDFCPFSGILLPGDLSQQYDAVLRRDLGITPLGPFDPPYPPGTLPREFRGSEEWWVKRGIGPTMYPRHVRAGLENAAAWAEPYEWSGIIYPDWPAALTRSKEVPPHLCALTLNVMSRGDYTYWYLPQTREYGIRTADPKIRIENQPIRILPVQYCPWCGEKLPQSLRPHWLDRLAALGLDEDSPHIPADLKSDAWWKNQGL